MSIPALKRLAVALGVFCAVLFVGSGFLFWSYGYLHLQAAFADEQTRIFDEMRTRALQSTAPPDIADALEYVVIYYPSGSKQRAGSKLDGVVERHRRAVVRDIVAHLRRTTGQDLGEHPEPWIQKYAPQHERSGTIPSTNRQSGQPNSAVRLMAVKSVQLPTNRFLLLPESSRSMPVEVAFQIGKPFPSISAVVEHLCSSEGWTGLTVAFEKDFTGATDAFRRLNASEIKELKRELSAKRANVEVFD